MSNYIKCVAGDGALATHAATCKCNIDQAKILIQREVICKTVYLLMACSEQTRCKAAGGKDNVNNAILASMPSLNGFLIVG
jgi:hypothetical protein